MEKPVTVSLWTIHYIWYILQTFRRNSLHPLYGTNQIYLVFLMYLHPWVAYLRYFVISYSECLLNFSLSTKLNKRVAAEKSTRFFKWLLLRICANSMRQTFRRLILFISCSNRSCFCLFVLTINLQFLLVLRWLLIF